MLSERLFSVLLVAEMSNGVSTGYLDFSSCNSHFNTHLVVRLSIADITRTSEHKSLPDVA